MRTIQLKATEQYFPVVLSIMLYKVVPFPDFQSEEDILWCDHSNVVVKLFSYE